MPSLDGPAGSPTASPPRLSNSALLPSPGTPEFAAHVDSVFPSPPKKARGFFFWLTMLMIPFLLLVGAFYGITYLGVQTVKAPLDTAQTWLKAVNNNPTLFDDLTCPASKKESSYNTRRARLEAFAGDPTSFTLTGFKTSSPSSVTLEGRLAGDGTSHADVSIFLLADADGSWQVCDIKPLE